ncbi:MAG TPA: DUF2635 domain-containing protein [Roseomonas sp.]|nr:DUF2635 domain-containing protein [Roseomonas sp.]
MYVKPVKGREVRDPVTQHALSPEGREVPESTFWMRRLRDGDVRLADAPKPAGKPAGAAEPAAEAKG